MVERAIVLKEAYQSMCAGEPKLAPYRLEDSQWDYLEKLCPLLGKFDEMTNHVSASKSFPTLNRTIIVYNALIDHLDAFIGTVGVDMTLKAAASAAREKLVGYYTKTDTTPVYAVATAMDPRMRFNWWKANDWGDYETMSKEMVEDIWNQHYKGQGRAAEVDAAIASQMKLYGIQSKAGELDEYVNESSQLVLCEKEPPELMYWRSQSERWPNLAAMAQDYLAIPATSTPAERCFSQAKYILPAERNCLLPSSIQSLVLLDSWIREKVIE
jgi:hypothetical protein